jgi:hypothetical protein
VKNLDDAHKESAPELFAPLALRLAMTYLHYAQKDVHSSALGMFVLALRLAMTYSHHAQKDLHPRALEMFALEV